jgi:hypothetical protein
MPVCELLPQTIKVQVSFATKKLPKVPYAVVLRIHAAHPTQVFAFGTHADKGKPHPDKLKANCQESPLKTDALWGAARPNFLGTGHRITPLVFSKDRVIVGIGNGKDPNRDTIIQEQTLKQQAVPIKVQERNGDVHDGVSQTQPNGQSIRGIAQGDQETDCKQDASDEGAGPTAAQNHKDHAADAAPNVPGGNDETPPSTDKGRDAPLVFIDVDLSDVPAGDPAGDRVAPLVNKDGHQADWFCHQGFPSDHGQGDVGNVQQEKHRLVVIATGPKREQIVATAVSHCFRWIAQKSF